MKQNSEPMVPASVVDRLIESHEKQIKELTAIIRNMTTPRVAQSEMEWTDHPWKSEDEEDLEYIAERERLASETLGELGFNSGDFSIE